MSTPERISPDPSPEGAALRRAGLLCWLCVAVGLVLLWRGGPGPGLVLAVLLAALPALVAGLLLQRRLLGPLAQVVAAFRGLEVEEALKGIAATLPLGHLREVLLHVVALHQRLRGKEAALARSAAEIVAMAECSKALSSSLTLKEVTAHALDFVERALEPDVACLLLLSSDLSMLSMRSRVALADHQRLEVELLATQAYFAAAGVLVEEGSLPCELDARGSEPSRSPHVTSRHWSAVCVEGRQIGVVGVVAFGEERPQEAEAAMLAFLSEGLSQALDHLKRSRAEETLRFRNVLESLAEGVVLLRPGGGWLLGTEQAVRFHELLCDPATLSTDEHAEGCPISLLGREVLTSRAASSRELVRQGKILVVEGTYVLTGATGEPGVVVSIRDVTEERATLQQLYHASKLASLGEMAAGVAHEVNNPLTGILGYSELALGRSDLDPELREALGDIHALAQRTRYITADLLAFSRSDPDAGLVAVDLGDILQDTLRFMRTTCRKERLEVVVDLEGAPLLVLGDRGKLQQVFLNLAQNAKDAIVMSACGSRISFVARSAGDGVRVEVQDDGPGIPAGVRERMFEPFYTTKPPGLGTGLGLAIVKRIVESHGAQLEVASSPESGTTFSMILQRPQRTEHAEALPALASPTPPSPVVAEPRLLQRAAHAVVPSPVKVPDSGKAGHGPEESDGPAAGVEGGVDATGSRPQGPLVLVVDDEESVLRIVRRALEAASYEVLATSDPDLALEHAVRRPVRAVICDLRMPGCSGEQLHERLMATRPDLDGRVLFLTGDASDASVRGFLERTAAPTLLKPPSLDELRAAVARLVKD